VTAKLTHSSYTFRLTTLDLVAGMKFDLHQIVRKYQGNYFTCALLATPTPRQLQTLF
jgi:hypothetical protein